MLMLMLMTTTTTLLLLLLHLLHSCLLLLLRLLLQLLDELRNGHSGLLGVSGELLLHRHDLLASGHLPWLGHLPGLRGTLHG